MRNGGGMAGVSGSQYFTHAGGTGLLYSCLPDIVLTLKGQREDSIATVCEQ
jgi:hypothetical protein